MHHGGNLIIIELFILIYIALLKIQNVNAFSLEQIGPVTPRMTLSEYCKGPKKLNCTRNTIEYFGDYGNVTYTMNVLYNTQVERIKLSIWDITNSTAAVGNAVLVRRVENPCNNIFFRQFLKSNELITDNCVMKKGVLKFNVDTASCLKDFIGRNFFRGKFRIQAITTGKRCNIACTVSEFLLDPDRSKN